MSRGQSWPLGLWCWRVGDQAVASAGGSLLTRCVSFQRAFNALCHSTHLYGRRLVLEWADSEVSLQTLRRKTAEHFHGKRTAVCWPGCGGQVPGPPSVSFTSTLRHPYTSPCQWEVLTRVGGIGGLHTLLVSQSSQVIGRPGRISGRGTAWVRVVTPPPPSLPAWLLPAGCHCPQRPQLTSSGSLHPALSIQGPVADPGTACPDFPVPATCLLDPPQLSSLSAFRFLPRPQWSQDPAPPLIHLGGITQPRQ